MHTHLCGRDDVRDEGAPSLERLRHRVPLRGTVRFVLFLILRRRHSVSHASWNCDSSHGDGYRPFFFILKIVYVDGVLNSYRDHDYGGGVRVGALLAHAEGVP